MAFFEAFNIKCSCACVVQVFFCCCFFFFCSSVPGLSYFSNVCVCLFKRNAYSYYKWTSLTKVLSVNTIDRSVSHRLTLSVWQHFPQGKYRLYINQQTRCLKIHIHSLPAGGALGASEIAVCLITAVNKAVLCSITLHYQAI